MQASMGAAPRFVSVVLAMLLAVTMLPAGGLQNAYADEPVERPATSGGDVALESANGGAGIEVADGGLLYTVADGVATLVGFEDGAALEGALAVPETVTDGTGTATVKAVEIAEGQVADKVTALALPQAVESVKTEGLASAFPMLASIEVASGTVAEGDVAAGSKGAAAKGAYSSVAGMLFRSAEGLASSDGTAFAEDALELVWAPPAMVVARIPLECKAIAAGAFVDAAAIETVMSFGKMESIAAAEKDAEGNVTKPGAFTDEQIGRLTIVVPGTNYAVTGEGAERVSGSVALSEKIDMLEKRKTWFHYGFDTEQIIMGAPFGEIEGVIGVDDEGKAEDRSLITPLQNGKGHLDLTPEEQAEVDARKAAEPKDGLNFSYQASMDLSVKWVGDKTATPAHVEIPAYVAIDDVTYQVTQIEPSAFEGAVFLSSVAIPEGVTAIGESAFAGCTNLKSVSLPSTLKTIDYAAFKGCAALESIDISESVRWIGGEAFEENIILMQPDGSTSESNLLSVPPHGAGSVNGVSSYSPMENAGQLSILDLSTTTLHAPSNLPATSGVVANSITTGSSDKPGFTWDEAFSRLRGGGYRFAPGNISWTDQWNATISSVQAARLSDMTLQEGAMDMRLIGTTFMTVGNGVLTTYEMRSLTPCGTGRTDQQFLNELVVSNQVNLACWHAHTLKQGDDYVASRAAIITTDGEWTPIESAWTVVSQSRTDAWGLTYNGKAVKEVYLYPQIDVNLAFDGGSAGDSAEGLPSDRTGIDPYRAFTLPADAPTSPIGRFVGWKLDGLDEIYAAGETIPYRTVYAADSPTLIAQWSPLYTARFVTGTGASLDNISYYKGDSPELPGAAALQRTGFWFAGWYPTGGSGYWADKQDGHTLYNGTMPADAHGDVTFTAVWTPKVYTVHYDTEASKDAGGTRVVDPPADKHFVHPSAANAINAASSLTFGIDADGGSVSGLNVVSNAYFDLASVAESYCTDYALGEPDKKLGAYPFQGWTKIDDLAIGTVPEPSAGGNQRYWTELRESDGAGGFTGTDYFFAIFGEGYSNFTKEQCATPYTVYGVWGVTDTKEIALGATQPSRLSNMSTDAAPEQVVDADGKGDATRGTESIRFRENMGFLGQASVETVHTGTPERHEAGGINDSEMGLEAPVRYGFQFLGWGPASPESTAADKAKEGGRFVASTTDVADVDGKLYIKYDETKSDSSTGFSITDVGAALIDADGDAHTYVYNDTDADGNARPWSAYWKTRTVDVTLRIPSHAVRDVDVTGESTGPSRHDKDDAGQAKHPLATKAEYDDYKWREGDANETGGGATSGWYIASRSWGYYDVLEYPEFKTQQDRYTYDGWYEMVKPSATDSTDKALEDLAAAGSPAMLTPVATYESLVQPNTRVRVTGLSEAEGGLTIPEGYFLTGQGKSGDGGYGRTMWLWASPIRINVASPVGVYLCTTNSYGQKVDPFVVGNDRRTQLEAQATFQVATNSHDLQLVGVTAEDVTAYAYRTNEDGTVVRSDDGDNAALVDESTIEAGKSSDEVGGNVTDKVGVASRILTPKYGQSATDGNDDKYRYSDEDSRMFWVSPVPTATADQTGVVYKGDSTAQAEAGKVPGTSNLVGDEADLKPDVETRRYFGFGYVGDGASDPDNRIEDTLSSSTSGGSDYDLGGFVLRRHDNYEGGQKDGLALIDHNESADTYRFYYGLDMRRADFNLTGLQDIIENSNGQLGYNSAFDQPLLRVKFTFAAARNPGISYFSARGGEGEAGAEKIPEETVITVGGAN